MRCILIFFFGLSVQTLEDIQTKVEVTRIEEERIQVLSNIEELEQKIKDLDTQLDESIREVCVKGFNYSRCNQVQNYLIRKNDYEHLQ